MLAVAGATAALYALIGAVGTARSATLDSFTPSELVLAGGDHALLEVAMATHAGMTTGEFGQMVEDWIATAKHPKTGKRFAEMTHKPMLELFAYLRAKGFKNFIVSAGGIEFMRPWAERVRMSPRALRRVITSTRCSLSG